jgi:DNA polymerase III alpha subunit
VCRLKRQRPAAVVQWDKDDCADMGTVKVDRLARHMAAIQTR